jgi:hypothetical protein
MDIKTSGVKQEARNYLGVETRSRFCSLCHPSLSLFIISTSHPFDQPPITAYRSRDSNKKVILETRFEVRRSKLYSTVQQNPYDYPVIQAYYQVLPSTPESSHPDHRRISFSRCKQSTNIRIRKETRRSKFHSKV